MTLLKNVNGREIAMTAEEADEFLASLPAIQTESVVSVSARQLKLQLLATGMIDAVDAWVAQQDRATRISYEYSGSFAKSSPMMQAGFAAMGFSSQQVDDFFTAASAL